MTKLTKKPKCGSSTSYSCGMACISNKKVCRAEVSEANASSILRAIKMRETGTSLAHKRSTTIVSPLRLGQPVKVNYDKPALTLTESEITEIESFVKDLLSKADLYINVSADSLTKILDSGRFMSQFETMTTSSAVLDLDARKDKEKSSFSYDTDTKPSDRPIYGTATNGGPYATGAGQYGDVVVKLKPSLRSRTTVTTRDSLSAVEGGTPINDPKIESVRTMDMTSDLNWQDYKRLSDVDKIKFDIAQTDKSESAYIEAQFHGGVSVADIALVTLRKDFKFDALFDRLTKQGVPVERR